ncbi:MAG: LysR family transcriptional regulator, partial [Actinomycetota bacterium]|nr:LysR family transcriptional regulator [Actinomycetota bacterium]
MELRQLATFVAVAEESSFTRAAHRLHVVQSAVSAGVRNLEKELGAMLFDRSTHSVKLTDAGRALLPESRDARRRGGGTRRRRRGPRGPPGNGRAR